jgi:hypothetical protein
MWIIQEPKKVALRNKRHFEEKNGACASCLKYSILIFVEKKYIKCNIWMVAERGLRIYRTHGSWSLRLLPEIVEFEIWARYCDFWARSQNCEKRPSYEFETESLECFIFSFSYVRKIPFCVLWLKLNQLRPPQRVNVFVWLYGHCQQHDGNNDFIIQSDTWTVDNAELSCKYPVFNL